MRSRKKQKGMLLLSAGFFLVMLGWMLVGIVQNSFQYIIRAPTNPIPSNSESELAGIYEEAIKTLSNLAEALPYYTVDARVQGIEISVHEGLRVDTTLYAIGTDYFDANFEQLRSGRLISETDINNASSVVVLDDFAALVLFKGDDALGRTVVIEDTEFTVVGTVRGGKRIGEIGNYLAYIPITTSSKHGIEMDTFEITAKGMDDTSSAVIMENTLRMWNPDGCFYNYPKLKLGALLPVRWILIILGMKSVWMLFCLANRTIYNTFIAYKQKLRTCYAKELVPKAMLNIAIWLLECLILGSLVLGLGWITIQPMYVFGEWIPNSIVELSSIWKCLWALNDANAVSVRYISRSYVCLEIGCGILRWGAGICLLGLFCRVAFKSNNGT